MSTAPTAPRSKPRRTVRFLPLLSLLLLVMIAALVVAAAVRGEWVDTAEKNPVSPEDDAVTQLFLKPNGNVVVRCAIVVNAAPRDIWGVVSSYDKHGEFLPHVTTLEATPRKDGRFLVVGVVHLPIWGDRGFTSLVKHAESPEKGEYAVSWSERDVDDFKLNRGSWSVTATDKSQRQSLLVCTVQLELKEWPNFVVRDILLYQLPPIVKAMRDESLRRKHG